MGRADYLLIVILAFLQASFLPINILLLLLLFLGLRRGVNYLIPRLLFAAVFLGLLTASSAGTLIVCLSLSALLFFTLKKVLPAANFIRLALLALSLPTYEIIYQQLFFLAFKP